MGVTIIGPNGLPLICEADGCGALATSAWSGSYGPAKLACDRHNPMSNAAVALPVNFTSHTLCHACGQPLNFTSHTLCHACGQPLNFSPQQQVIYPGTAG